MVECHGGFGADDLIGLLGANGARFELVEREVNPDYGCETVTLRRLASSAARRPPRAPGPRRTR